MDYEGMVHALEEIRRLLNLDGVLVKILPAPEGYFLEVLTIEGFSLLNANEKPLMKMLFEPRLQSSRSLIGDFS